MKSVLSKTLSHVSAGVAQRSALSTLATSQWTTTLSCSGCHTTVDSAASPLFSCPNQGAQPEIDHVLAPVAVDFANNNAAAKAGTSEEPSQPTEGKLLPRSPFVRYRKMLNAYRVARARGMTDAEYVDLVDGLEESLQRVDGTGFVETPLLWNSRHNVFMKNETGAQQSFWPLLASLCLSASLHA